MTYWIPGNHEYYYYNADSSSFLETKIRENIFLVNNCVKEISGVNLIFSTLWSNISEEKRWVIQQSLSDFKVIKFNVGELRNIRLFDDKQIDDVVHDPLESNYSHSLICFQDDEEIRLKLCEIVERNYETLVLKGDFEFIEIIKIIFRQVLICRDSSRAQILTGTETPSSSNPAVGINSLCSNE